MMWPIAVTCLHIPLQHLDKRKMLSPPAYANERQSLLRMACHAPSQNGVVIKHASAVAATLHAKPIGCEFQVVWEQDM